jgi:hypothetical protein
VEEDNHHEIENVAPKRSDEIIVEDREESE